MSYRAPDWQAFHMAGALWRPLDMEIGLRLALRSSLGAFKMSRISMHFDVF